MLKLLMNKYKPDDGNVLGLGTFVIMSSWSRQLLLCFMNNLYFYYGLFGRGKYYMGHWWIVFCLQVRHDQACLG